MLAVTGRPGALGDADPVPDRVGLADADGEPPDGLGLADVVEEAGDADPSPSNSAGIAISAPMTMNTAAMTTLGNCIAVLPARGPSGGR
ncbi:hypothetical protein LUW74_45100 [Actinomadura madurae]|uniref:hypothetical protein n=1 Tax=Actinomadura madurae TaxID=1993 RepID=UPI0003AD3889|nr:hypothetical protein [Actinomadura madurae]URN09828.1 hypothetical protein LUW74_45100 [Actinomadura madurae]